MPGCMGNDAPSLQPATTHTKPKIETARIALMVPRNQS